MHPYFISASSIKIFSGYGKLGWIAQIECELVQGGVCLVLRFSAKIMI